MTNYTSLNEQLEQVTEQTLGEVLAIYDAVHTALETGENGPGWRRGIYPTEIDARSGLEVDTLYVLRDEDTRLAVATVILNHDQPSAYADVRWKIDVQHEQVMVVHTFMVHPGFYRRGFGERTLTAAHALAREKGCRCIRLDTYAENRPAAALYRRMGYHEVGLIDLGYGQYGLHWYRAFELPL